MSSEKHSVEDFRNILTHETRNLNHLCERWSKVLEEESTLDPQQDQQVTGDDREDLLGAIRSTIGQAKLLMSQRFKQFTDLINQCESNSGQHVTTLNDLSGFWDMISFQVSDVMQKFKSLDNRHQRVACGESNS